MNIIIENAANELNQLAENLRQAKNNRAAVPFSQQNSLAAPLNRNDLAAIAESLAKKTLKIDEKLITPEIEGLIFEIPNRLQKFNVINLFNNNNNLPYILSIFFELMQWVDGIISPLCNDWEYVDKNQLPKSLSKRLQETAENLDSLIVNKQDLEKKLHSIESASLVIENIADELERLEAVKEEIEEIRKNTAIEEERIVRHSKEIGSFLHSLEGVTDEIEQIIKKANEAYKLATTTGLAGAFDKRANSLRQSMWLWIAGLLAALTVGAWIGSIRFKAVQTALSGKTEPGYIWILIFLSVLSLGAPIWFAWIATKQVGHRFKLSEDYAFKSSVAKAYEGYKQEAAKLDSEMELKLFNSALTRFDEAPLRLMDKETHGSPWHELFNHPALAKAKPEEIIEILKSALIKGKESKGD